MEAFQTATQLTHEYDCRRAKAIEDYLAALGEEIEDHWWIDTLEREIEAYVMLRDLYATIKYTGGINGNN